MARTWCGWQFIAVVLAALLITGGVWADETATDATATEAETAKLQRETQNPVANLISVPFQNNFNFHVGPERVTQYILNVQPVIPITLNDDWNLITRWIMPFIDQPSPAHGTRSAAGLGDINPTFFFAPTHLGKLILGVGPTCTLPTATDPLLGAGKWDLGPSVVVLTMQGPWVFGALANNQWSYAGWGDHSINQMLVQPFINYNLDKGWYFTSAPIITANWNAKGRDVWTTPIGAGAGRLFRVGKLPVNCQLGAYSNIHTPEFGPDWQLRFQVQLLFPK
jgi:hypothetical protein